MDALPPNWIHTGLAVAISGALLSALLHWFASSLDHGRHEWSRALRRRLGVLPHMRVAEVRWANRAVQLTLWLVATSCDRDHRGSRHIRVAVVRTGRSVDGCRRAASGGWGTTSGRGARLRP